MLPYKRILLKLSGEALKANSDDFIDVNELEKLSSIIKKILEHNIDIGIVVGGGNIVRGRMSEKMGLERVNLDYVGMMATNLNAKILENVFTKNGIKCKTYSKLPVKDTIEEYDPIDALKNIENHVVCIFGGGEGRPYISTDTASASRAYEIKADVILSGKNKVDGVYDSSPSENPNAKLYKTVSYDEILEKKITVIDLEAIEICKKHNIVIRAFNMNSLDNILKVLEDETMGTTIRKE